MQVSMPPGDKLSSWCLQQLLDCRQVIGQMQSILCPNILQAPSASQRKPGQGLQPFQTYTYMRFGSTAEILAECLPKHDTSPQQSKGIALPLSTSQPAPVSLEALSEEPRLKFTGHQSLKSLRQQSAVPLCQKKCAMGTRHHSLQSLRQQDAIPPFRDTCAMGMPG